jgi:MYXO-CTERM domain-containing protein
MKHIALVGALVAAFTLPTAGAVTLNFDDVGVQNQYINFDQPYQGFNFSFTLDVIDLVDSVWDFGARSGEFALLNNYGGVGTVTAADGGDFSFDGVWAKVWSTTPESGGAPSLFGSMRGLNDGAVIWSVDTALNGSYQFFGAQAGQIDTLELGFGNFFQADDLSLNGVSVVPEASTWAMMALGLGALGALRRRRAA